MFAGIWTQRIAAHAMLTLAFVAVAASSAAAQQTIVPPDSAVHYVGKTVTVQGVVAGVHATRGGTIFVDFGARYPQNTFTAVIFSSSAAKFPGASAWEGKTVRVSGEVKLYRGKPEIVLENASQVTVPAGE